MQIQEDFKQSLFKVIGLNEENNQETKEMHLSIELLDIDAFIKTNDIQEITNSLFFVRDNYPTPDGLLSNEIFGLTKEDRANIFGYVKLESIFLHPLCYKKWSRMDSRIKNIVHGTTKYIINDQGDFVEDEKGKTGIKFLKDNFDKIKIKSTDSAKRDVNIKFLKANKDVMFMDKYIIIPPYYRDVNTTASYIGVGAINKLYASLLMAVKALRETADYGFAMDDACRGRIQEIILSIYDYFCGNTNNSVDSDTTGMSKKLGLVKRSNLSKTTDYASRLVLSAPNLRVERLEDLMVDMDHSAIPISSICSTFYPYILFSIRKMFDDWFNGTGSVEYIDKDGNTERVVVKEPLIQFSDDRIKDELKRFIHGYANRFVPVEVEVETIDGKPLKKIHYLRFKGFDRQYASNDDSGRPILVSRRMCWLDIFYMAACEVSKDKTVLITRYPIDSARSQFPTGIVVSSTKETESIYYGNTYYKWYPRIREEDIEKNTSEKFIDTLQICNLFLNVIEGDYDGDQCSVKGMYTIESNEELTNYMNSKANYIGFDGINMRISSNEAVQCIYNLTKILSTTKLKPFKFAKG